MTDDLLRYAVKLKNGSYMIQNIINEEKIQLIGADLPIDADMFRLKSVADRVVKQINNGITNIGVEFEPELAPISIVSFNINYHENKSQNVGEGR